MPDSIGRLEHLKILAIRGNRIIDLPCSLASSKKLEFLDLENNDLNTELATAYEEGIDFVKRYLKAKTEKKVILNEAKLILIGEGEVGKSCLLSALRNDQWEEGKPTTHGIEIKSVKVVNPDHSEIILNGWDFGGQRVYRPTHQLFFTAPAVYLVVWKPREGPQQGFVKEWIKLVKHREQDAKILVVATHGGPNARQPDIDRQEIWDLFGKETVSDFFFVQSKPDEETGERHGINELRQAIANTASALPDVGRTFPLRWQNAREALKQCGQAYLTLDQVLEIYRKYEIEEQDFQLLLRIGRAVGDLIHFEHDPLLKNIVILKPDWLATSISFILDDEYTRQTSKGLIYFERLSMLWNDKSRNSKDRYPSELHPIFLRLMERFDLCYRVIEPGIPNASEAPSLIAQLVPDVRPNILHVWPDQPEIGDDEQIQICRIIEVFKNQSATAEGIFYQLIVRLHKYSLGRNNFHQSIHWQRGIVLQDEYGARALVEHIENNIRIRVRSPYPERFLSAITYDVKWLVESFWEGLRCEVTVPCLVPKTNGQAWKVYLKSANYWKTKNAIARSNHARFATSGKTLSNCCITLLALVSIR